MEIKEENHEQKAPLLQDKSPHEQTEKTLVQKIISQTFHSTSHLAKRLPAGAVLGYQLLSPISTKDGECNSVQRYFTAALVALCGLLCFLLSFTDSFNDKKGNVCYGFATFQGMVVIDGSARLITKDAANYKLKVIDFLHGLMTVLVFATIVMSDQKVVTCFYPAPSDETREVLAVLPIGIGVICSLLFVFFPTQRHGIGFPHIAELDEECEVNAVAKPKYTNPQDVEEGKTHSDSHGTKTFLEWAISEIKDDPKLLGLLIPSEFFGLIEKFCKITGNNDDQKQMENIYDTLKKDCTAWEQIKNPSHVATRMGWDNINQTQSAPNHWWNKMMQYGAKFGEKPLEHGGLVEQVYEGVSVMGKLQCTLGKEISQTHLIDEDGRNTNTSVSAAGKHVGVEEFLVDLNGDETHKITSSEKDGTCKRRLDALTPMKNKKGKRKVVGSIRLRMTIERMLNAVESQGSEFKVKWGMYNQNATTNCKALPQLPPPCPNNHSSSSSS